MDKNIFRRVEKKYIITKEKLEELMNILDDYIVEDKYFENTICNIYFDSDDYTLISKSIDKPVYKEKVRMRSYFVPSLDTKVFLEIKKKYKGVVGKRRVAATLKEIYEYLENGIDMENETQIMKEIDYMFKLYDLKPKAFIAYDRLSYHAKNNKDFRITIDKNLRARLDNLRLEYSDEGFLILDENKYIMEIKTLDAYPKWFADVLSSLKIYPSSFSKYGNLYKNYILKNKEEKNV